MEKPPAEPVRLPDEEQPKENERENLDPETAEKLGRQALKVYKILEQKSPERPLPSLEEALDELGISPEIKDPKRLRIEAKLYLVGHIAELLPSDGEPTEENNFLSISKIEGRSAKELLEYSIKELLVKHIYELLPPDSKPTEESLKPKEGLATKSILGEPVKKFLEEHIGELLPPDSKPTEKQLKSKIEQATKSILEEFLSKQSTKIPEDSSQTENSQPKKTKLPWEESLRIKVQETNPDEKTQGEEKRDALARLAFNTREDSDAGLSPEDYEEALIGAQSLWRKTREKGLIKAEDLDNWRCTLVVEAIDSAGASTKEALKIIEALSRGDEVIKPKYKLALDYDKAKNTLDGAHIAYSEQTGLVYDPDVQKYVLRFSEKGPEFYEKSIGDTHTEREIGNLARERIRRRLGMKNWKNIPKEDLEKEKGKIRQCFELIEAYMKKYRLSKYLADEETKPEETGPKTPPNPEETGETEKETEPGANFYITDEEKQQIKDKKEQQEKEKLELIEQISRIKSDLREDEEIPEEIFRENLELVNFLCDFAVI